MKLVRLLVYIACFEVNRQHKCLASIFAIKAQNLFALKQAIIASKLPIGQQIVLLPPLTAATTRRPNVTTAATTTRPPVTTTRPTVTTARPTVAATTATTLRPSTIIGIQQWFPSNHYFPHTGSIQFPGGLGQHPGVIQIQSPGGPQPQPGLIQQYPWPASTQLQGVVGQPGPGAIEPWQYPNPVQQPGAPNVGVIPFPVGQIQGQPG